MSVPSLFASLTLGESTRPTPCITDNDDGSCDITIPAYGKDELSQFKSAGVDPFASLVGRLRRRGGAVRHVCMAVAPEIDPWLASLVSQLPDVSSVTVTARRSDQLPDTPGGLLDTVDHKDGWTIGVFKLVNDDLANTRTSVSTALAKSFLPHARVGVIDPDTMSRLCKLKPPRFEAEFVSCLHSLIQGYSDAYGRSLPLPRTLADARALRHNDNFADIFGCTGSQASASSTFGMRMTTAALPLPTPAELATVEDDLPIDTLATRMDALLKVAGRRVARSSLDKLEKVGVPGLTPDAEDGIKDLAKFLERCGERTVVQLDAPIHDSRGSTASRETVRPKVVISSASVRTAVEGGRALLDVAGSSAWYTPADWGVVMGDKHTANKS